MFEPDERMDRLSSIPDRSNKWTILVLIAALGNPGYMHPAKPLDWPSVRFDFKKVAHLRKDLLKMAPSRRTRDDAWVVAFGILPPGPVEPPLVDGSPVLDYRYAREDLQWYASSRNYTLTLYYPRGSKPWPDVLRVSIGSQVVSARRSPYFDMDDPVYMTDDPPTEKTGALPFKEDELRWLVITPAGSPPAKAPEIQISDSYAALQSVSDGNGHWAGTFLAFTPDLKRFHASIEGRPVQDLGRPEKLVEVK